jgi:hypothetical protein
MSALPAIKHARAVRQRLRHPPNAVADQGIDLKRKPELAVVEPAPPSPPEPAPLPGIDTPLPECVLKDVVARIAPGALGIRSIQLVVCEYYGVSLIDLLSSRRTKAIVLPRQVAVWLCRRLTPHSLPALGPHFGGRDHTTMLHNARRIDELRQSDPAMQALLDAFIAALQRS